MEHTKGIPPARVRDILSVLKEAAAAGDTEMPVWEEGKPCFHVLSNSRGIDGFSAVLYPGVLKGFADAQGKDLYVLPSSRHEALLLPDDGNLDVEELRCMVRQVNDTEVAGEDILSYRVYAMRPGSTIENAEPPEAGKARGRKDNREASRKEPSVSPAQMDALKKELQRTGVAMEAVKERYQIDRPEEMSSDIYRKVMSALAKTKPADAA